GDYKLQPIFVDDLAKLAIEQGGEDTNRIIDAIGPETFTYRGLVQTIGECIGHSPPILSVSPSLGYAAGWLIGAVTRDLLITREEILGLMSNLLCTASPPVGTTRLTDWARDHSNILGQKYASELA